MGRPRRDDVDGWCEVWAAQWVTHFIKSPEVARDAIGPLGCTLGRIRELHDGASSNTTHDRRWPECFLGDGLVVAIALKHMSACHRDLLLHHYVCRRFNLDSGKPLRWPIRASRMAERMGLRVDCYSRRLTAAKTQVRELFLGSKNILDY